VVGDPFSGVVQPTTGTAVRWFNPAAFARPAAGTFGNIGRDAIRGPGFGSFDPGRMYLKEIGKGPLLTAGQEVTLARRIEAGLHAAERLEVEPDLTDEAKASLEAVATDGELAKRTRRRVHMADGLILDGTLDSPSDSTRSPVAVSMPAAPGSHPPTGLATSTGEGSGA